MNSLGIVRESGRGVVAEGPGREPRTRVLIRLLGAITIVAVAARLQQLSGVNPDVAWFVEVARRTGEGTPLYLDAPGSFVEVNPPMVVWTLMPAIWLARRLGLWIASAPALLVTAEAIVGIALSSMVVRRAQRDARWLVWLIAMVGLVLPAHDFAQREHQLVLLLAPALVALVVSPTGTQPRWLQVAVGVSAGLGLSLKPHFVMAWVLTELTVAALDRRPRQLLRVENGCAAGFLGLYALAVLALTPGYVRLMGVWGPLYLHMLVKPFLSILAAPESVATFGVLSLAFCLRRTDIAGRTAKIFAVAATMFLGTVVVQHKGFNYHYLPALAFTCVALVSCLLVLNELQGRRFLTLATVGLSAFVLTLLGNRVIVALVLGHENRRLTQAYESELKRADATVEDEPRFVVLSTNLVHAFPMSTLIGQRWPIRFPSLWALETSAPAGCAPPRARDQAIERRFMDGLWTDLSSTLPRVLIVAPLPPSMHPHPGCATVADHLSRDPRFAAFFARYTAADTIPRVVHGPFVVYRRDTRPF